jgi:glycolate oxidase iron-sulfur subunit
MQHGQRLTDLPKRLLQSAGFQLRDVPEGHICCGSAGTYNILQPSFARRLRRRKIGNIERLKPDVIATGNIGCITQIGGGTKIPIVHTVQLLDWAYGGPALEELVDFDTLGPPNSIASLANSVLRRMMTKTGRGMVWRKDGDIHGGEAEIHG